MAASSRTAAAYEASASSSSIGSTRSRLNWQQSSPSSFLMMLNHCSGSGQRFTAKQLLMPRCRRGMIFLPFTRLSAAYHLITLEFPFVENNQRAVEDALAVVTAGIDTERAANLARGVSFVNMPVQTHKRLVTLNGSAYRR